MGGGGRTSLVPTKVIRNPGMIVIRNPVHGIRNPEAQTVIDSGAVPERQFSENMCSKDDLRSRIFGTFVVKFLACLPLLGFSNI